MLKNSAISAINAYNGETLLNNGNTWFANLNRAKSVSWFDIPLGKIDGEVDSKLHLVVFDPDRSELHHLAVPPQYVCDNLRLLVARTDDGRSSLQFLATGNRLCDLRPRGRTADFSQLSQTTCTAVFKASCMQSIQNDHQFPSPAFR